MEPSLSTAPINFIREESAVGLSEDITTKMCLQDDLGGDGDDATELLLAYAKTCHVDVSQFMAADYFDAKGLNMLV